MAVRRGTVFDERHLRGTLSLLIELARVKGLYLKPRDVRCLGIEDHVAMTRLGILLNRLVELGLARKWNNRRPIRYSLVPRELWARFIEICSLDCERGDTLCGLYGLCPYHVLLGRMGNGEAGQGS